MPKPFVIGIEVEEIAVGTVLRRLNEMPGVIALHMDFQKSTAKKSTKEDAEPSFAFFAPAASRSVERNARGRISRTLMRENVLAALSKAAPRDIGVRDLISKWPTRKASIYQVMHQLGKDKLVRRTDVGRYALVNGADVETSAAASPAEASSDLSPQATKILALFDERPIISTKDVRRVLRVDKNRGDWQIKSLVAKGFIKKAGKRGEYERVTTGGA
jgi:hypothetical protein